MYASSFVETSATEELFARPHHPYTVAPMAAIPRLEPPTHTALQTIPDGVQDMTKPITGCRLAARARPAKTVTFGVQRGDLPPLRIRHEISTLLGRKDRQ
ncbi:oligopeptide/dipeptide ABC transporter ATP-binding protein [Rhodococcus erythropolis]|uniref:oligopeptide/dipeptide ABC transporter ATP-binding protein n=1 Tax=Rhodococcus erythropolis TaxID=1833 RepID=UPI0009BECBA7|nr:oligopeptide/dipeptide ABC transporter ATP-binding protein [Rhodococcus erythropolis]